MISFKQQTHIQYKTISTACWAKSALYWILRALCQGKQTKQIENKDSFLAII
jgi:hypothetical protein